MGAKLVWAQVYSQMSASSIKRLWTRGAERQAQHCPLECVQMKEHREVLSTGCQLTHLLCLQVKKEKKNENLARYYRLQDEVRATKISDTIASRCCQLDADRQPSHISSSCRMVKPQRVKQRNPQATATRLLLRSLQERVSRKEQLQLQRRKWS